ncbi:hypothetical protein [Endozoicomonas sp. ALD040]|uniref:hypothetical protein n=1 Tax=Endozoicomonas sp. ALD040 TaxID=3403079 RepID=UPI003BAEAD6C
MTNARPNALSLAVAIALSSSIISTQAITERKLQTKSLDISNDEHLSFTQSLVSVQPTLAGDQQPIPKSFTTTYPDQTQAREGCAVPSEGFTDILSAVSADVTSVDLFETGENDVAQKYTKVLKVGDEEVFRFTHGLGERELIIEVRGGMTDQETIDAVRDQLTVIPSLEPSTKIARPEQLHAVLEGADDRAGDLGTSDYYVALATIKVEPIEVNGRTFMRLIASGDQPPELTRLTQSLFVNDEALLAAATSAYIQVHVLKEELQQEALDRLLALSKPVGYVMQREDSTRVYPAPSGYPKLVPSHTQEDTIVFYSQKLNPADIAFVENLYDLLAEAEPDGLTHATTKVKTYKVKSYQHVIRSRQWALLEELAAQGNAEFSKDKLTSLAYYESLQQALYSARPYRTDEFELTLEHLKVTSSVLTPTWIHYQLVRHFGFRSAMKTLLTDQRFIQNMEELIPFIRVVQKVQADGDEEFAARVVKGMSAQMINTYNKIEALRTKEGEYNRLLKHLEDNAKEKLRALELKHELAQKAEEELAQTRKALEELRNRSQKPQQEVERIPALEKQVLDARADASKVYNSQLAKELGIDNWDNTQPTEEQARIIIQKINEINQMVAATGKAHFYKQAIRMEMAAIETIFHITPVDKDDLNARFRGIYEQLLQKSELTFEGAQQTLAMAEDELGLTRDNEEDLIARFRSILETLRQMALESARQFFQDQQQGQEEQKNQLQKLQQEAKRIPELEQKVHDARTDATKDRNAQTAAELGIDDWDDTLPLEEQARLIRKKIQAIKPSVAATEEPDEETVKAKPAGTGKKGRIILVDEDQLATLLITREQLQQNPEQPDEEIREKLSDLEDQLGLVPNKEDDLQARHQNILKHLEQEAFDVSQRELRERKNRLEKLLQIGEENQLEKLVQKAGRVPELEKELLTVKRYARKIRCAQRAAKLGIDDWDEARPLEEQRRLIEEKINDIYRSMAATGHPDEETVTAEPAAIGGRRVIASVNKNNPGILLFIQKELQQNTKLSDEEVQEKLTIFESHLGLVPENNDDLEARHRAIQQHLKQQAPEIVQQPLLITHEQRQQNPEQPDEDFQEKLSDLEDQLGLVPNKEDDLQARHQNILKHLEQEAFDVSQRELRKRKNRLEKLLKTGVEKLVHKADTVPELQKQLLTVRRIARNTNYAHTAARLGIHDWDDTLPLEEQQRLIEEEINDIYRSMAATGQPDEEALTGEPAAISGRRGIASVNKNNPATLLLIQKRLQGNTKLTDEEVREKLTIFEDHLGLVPENNDDLKARHRTIQQHLKQQITEIVQQPFQNQQQQEDKRISELKRQVLTARAAATKVRNAQLAAELGMDDWDDTQSPEEQARLIREKINEIKPSVVTTAQSDEETLEAEPSAMQIEEENQLEKLVQKADMVPELQKQILTVRRIARQANYAHTAARLGIDDWNELLPLEEQHRLIEEKINDIYRSMAATGQPDEEAVTAESAAISGRRGIASVNKNNPATLLLIQKRLQGNTELADEEVREKLTAFESHLGLVPENNDDLKARHQAIQQHLKQQVTETAQQPFQNQHQQEDKRISELEQQILTARADATKVRNAQLAAELGMDDWDDSQSSEEQARLIREKINKIKPSVATTGQSDEEAVKAKPPTISQKRGITSVDEEDPAALHFTPRRQRLEQNEELPYPEILERLTFFENKLGLVPENEDDPEVRLLSLHQGIQKESRRAYLQHVENQEELAKRRNWLKFLQDEVNRISIPKKEAPESMEENRKNYNIQLAAALEIDDWDDTQPLEQQDSLIRQKIRDLKQPATVAQITASSMTPTTIAPTKIAPTPVIATSLVTATLSVTTTNAATAQTPQEAFKETLAAIESRHNITPDDENDLLARCQFVQQYLQQKHAELADFSEVENKLAWIEGQLGLTPGIERDPEVRCQTIRQHLGEQNAQIAQQQQLLQQQSTGTETEIEAEIKARYATIAAHLNIENFDSNADIGDQQKHLLQELKKLNLQQDLLLSKMKQQFPYTREEDYGDDAGIDEQNSLIEAKLKQLDAEIFKARQLEVNVRIAAIDDELDGQMARLGPEPRDVLDRDLAMARRTILVAENKLAGLHRKLNDLPRKKLAVTIGNDVHPAPDGDDEAATKNLNTRIKGQKIHETRQSVTVKSIASRPVSATPVATASIAPTPVSAMPVATASIVSTPVSAMPLATASIASTPVSATPFATASIASTAHYQEEKLKKKLPAIASWYDFTSDNEPEVLHKSVKRDIKQRLARITQQKQHLQQDLQQLLQQQSTGTRAEKEAEIKARFATIAEHSNIQGFDSNANIDVQQELLIQKFEEINAREQDLRQQLYTMANQQDIEHSYTLARKDALAAVIGLDRVPEDRAALELIVRDKLSQLAELEQELEDIRTPGHPKAMSEVLQTLRAAEKVLKDERLTKEQDVYLRRMDISVDMRAFIREARKHSENKALMTLSYLENLLNIKADEDDHKAARLKSILTRLDDGDISNYQLDQMDMNLWPEIDRSQEDLEQVRMDLRLLCIRDRLIFIVKESDKRAIEKQAEYLVALEKELNIDPDKNPAAKARGKTFLAKLASDLQIEFYDDDSKLSKQYALRSRIQKLRKEVNEIYDDEGVRRIKNNKIAEQLDIKDYGDDAGIDEQNSLIEAKLEQLEAEFFKAVQLDVNERIAAIDDALDRQMARLGPKPRYVLDRDVAMARRAILAAETKLEWLHRKLNDLPRKKLAVMMGNDVHPVPDEDDEAAAKNLNTRIKDDLGSLAEIQEQARLEGEIETQKADIVKLKEALNTAEKAVIGDGGPFQYSPDQEKVLNAIHKFTKQHPLKKRALEAAIGLTEAAIEHGKAIPFFTSFDFNDEFAAIHLQAMIGDKLTFEQAGRIVEIFNDLKATFPESPSGSVEDQPRNVLKEIEILTDRARMHLEAGARQYDVEIRGMGLAGIHYVEQESKDLKSFSEYFATRSASGNKIIALLREGLISKIELENYMKAVKGVDGYQTVDEFEHFLGHKHGIRVSDFKAAVQMLSDQGVEELIQSAFTPVTLTATGPAGMKESVAGMTEYAAAVIANYVLDDIAFDNGRRTAAFLTNIQDTLTPYANAVGMSESELIKIVHNTLMQAHAAAVEQKLNDYWVKPSAFLVQAVTWYYSSYKPILATHSDWQAAKLSLANMSFLYLLDLTNRGDYLHRMLTPFQHWLERYGVDLDRTGQYAYHSGIEQISEVGGLAMPLGKAASSVILLKTGSALFTRQYNANPHSYRSLSRLVPEIVKSMGSGQGVQVPLLNRVTPQKVKTLASATAGLVLGPVATVGAYAHGLLSGFTYAQTFGFALASGVTFDFFMNDNKMLTQWLGGPLGRSLDRINRWRGGGETQDEYVKRTAIATPQRYSETDEEYANRVKANNTMYGWTRHENYLQFRERRDRTMKMLDNSWEKYFRENVPKWSFSHAESIPYSYTLGALFESGTAAPEAASTAMKAALADHEFDKDKNTRDEL